MNYNIPKAILLGLCLSSTMASAQVVGGILCGIGAFCPPETAPSKTTNPMIIKGSPMGSSISDYYGELQHSSFSNKARYFLKIQVGSKLTWETSAWGRHVGGELTVLKIGTRSDNFDNCFKYQSALRVTDYDMNTKTQTLIAKEDYTGAACTIGGLNPDPRMIHEFLYYEVDARNVNWK